MNRRRKAHPLSGRGTEIEWESDGSLRHVWWGGTGFVVADSLVKGVLEQFFREANRWYPLGAGMTEPIPGGLGEFIQEHSTLTPRHASAIAAILVAEGLLEHRGNKAIELRKVHP